MFTVQYQKLSANKLANITKRQWLDISAAAKLLLLCSDINGKSEIGSACRMVHLLLEKCFHLI